MRYSSFLGVATAVATVHAATLPVLSKRDDAVNPYKRGEVVCINGKFPDYYLTLLAEN
jgi:hypothetical protein